VKQADRPKERRLRGRELDQAAAAVALHLGRLGGYALGGVITTHTLALSAVLAAAILASNLIGDGVRRTLDRRAEVWIEHGALIACVGFALAIMR
jgi:hypothetical protein